MKDEAQRNGRFQRWLLLGGGAVVLLTAAAELGLRVFGGLGHPLLLQKDPEIGYLYQPRQQLERFGHQVRINSFHQRADEVTARPGAGVQRILFVGDSVTFGTTLLDQSEIITERVARGWPATGQTVVEVLNASAGSWGLGNELAYLRRFGTFGAGTVVLQIGTHDLLQRTSTSERVGRDPAMPDRPPFSALSELWIRYLRPRLTGEKPFAPGRPPAAEAPAQFAANMAALTEAIALVRRSGAQPVILHTPNRDELGPGRGPQANEDAGWRREFLAVAQSAQVPVINLPADWAAETNTRRYYLDEVHLSADGTRAVARAFLDSVAAGWKVTSRPVPGSSAQIAGSIVR